MPRSPPPPVLLTTAIRRISSNRHPHQLEKHISGERVMRGPSAHNQPTPILVPARVGAGNGHSNETSLTVPPSHLLWLISATDRCDHAVTISDIEAGLVAGRGTYQSICGHTVYTCSMLTPPGTPCTVCRERLAVPRKRRHRRNRRWWPLCTLCSRTTSVSGGDPRRILHAPDRPWRRLRPPDRF